VCSNPSSSEETLDYLFEDKNDTVRNWMINNPNLPAKYFMKLYNGADCDRTRYRILTHKKIPTSILENLYNKPNRCTRSSIAINTRTPEHILRRLSDDNERYVLESLIWNKRTPKDVLIKLTNHTDSRIRMISAGRREIPKNILIELLNDSNVWVSSNARRNLWLRFKEYEFDDNTPVIYFIEDNHY